MENNVVSTALNTLPEEPPTLSKLFVMYAICLILSGLCWYAIRVCVSPEEGSGYPPCFAAAMRFSIACIVSAILWRFWWYSSGDLPSKCAAVWLMLAGLLSAAAHGLIYSAEQSISGGLAAVITATIPLFVVLSTVFVYVEPISKATVSGCLVALAGVALVFRNQLHLSATNAWAIVHVLGAAAIFAPVNIIFKRWGTTGHPLAVIAVYFLPPSLALWAMAIWKEWHLLPHWPPPLGPTLALLYLAIGVSVAALWMYLRLLKYVRLMSAKTVIFVQPLIAVLVDALWEKRAPLTVEVFFGMGVVMVGVAIHFLGSNGNHATTATIPEKPPSG